MLKSFLKENETEAIKKIRAARQPFLDERRKVLAEKSKLELALLALPGEISETEKIHAEADPLALGFEEFEKLQKKRFFLLDREGRLKTNIGECDQRLNDLYKKINDSLIAELSQQITEISREWLPDRKRLLELLALYKLRTGGYDLLTVVTAIFKLNDPSTMREFQEIYEKMTDEWSKVYEG